MQEHKETVLLAWARDADGDCQQFTGADINDSVGRWCSNRLRRGIPTIATYYCDSGGYRFVNSIAIVPVWTIPLFVRLRPPDDSVEYESPEMRERILLFYLSTQDG